jgi:hypothetical protein
MAKGEMGSSAVGGQRLEGQGEGRRVMDEGRGTMDDGGQRSEGQKSGKKKLRRRKRIEKG